MPHFQYVHGIQPAAPYTCSHWEKMGRGTLSGAPIARLTSSPLRRSQGPLLFFQFTMIGRPSLCLECVVALSFSIPLLTRLREYWIHNLIKERVGSPRVWPELPVCDSVRNHVPFQQQAWGQSASCLVVRGTL